jgi:hypothetical protein
MEVSVRALCRSVAQNQQSRWTAPGLRQYVPSYGHLHKWKRNHYHLPEQRFRNVFEPRKLGHIHCNCFRAVHLFCSSTLQKWRMLSTIPNMFARIARRSLGRSQLLPPRFLGTSPHALAKVRFLALALGCFQSPIVRTERVKSIRALMIFLRFDWGFVCVTQAQNSAVA